MIHRWEIWRRIMRRRLSRAEWLRSAFHRSISEHTETDPGILLIQIDGLSFRQLERAVSDGRMPFLRRLLHRENYRLTTFYSGIPSTTPAVQGELYYGTRCAVPAFGFLDRATDYLGSMYETNVVKGVQYQLEKRCKRPLLEGGSSWSNMYSGGAAPEETHFCGSALNLRDIWRSISFPGLLLATILYFPAVIRLLLVCLWEHFSSAGGLIKGVAKGEPLLKELGLLISRVAIGTGLREVITIGAAVDLSRGLPIIHLNYLGYDERAHHRGPGSPFAHRLLRALDRNIKQLYRRAHLSQRRDYQVWIFSDHGQETVRSYVEDYKGTLGEVVLEGMKRLQKAGFKGFRSLAANDSRQSWIRVAQVTKHMQGHERADNAPPEEQDTFAIAARGPIAHVYLAKSVTPEERKLLGRWLVTEANIPGALILNGPGEVLWIHAKGEILLPCDASSFLPHPEPIRAMLAKDLVTWCEHPNSGDLILLGWHPEKHPFTFPVERGSHGGPGIEETEGFALLPANTPVPEDAKEVLRPSALRAAALHTLGRERIRSRAALRTSVRRLRVMTYNVHSCIGMDGKVSPARIARVIRSFDPDVVALQEIDLGRARTRRHDQARMIAEELDMQSSFCCTVEENEELYGHALLSRFPLEVLGSGLYVVHPRARDREPRGVLLAKVQLDGEEVYLLNTHFGLRDYERAAHIEDLLGPNWLGRTPPDKPLVLCGDFNMWPGSKPYRTLLQRGLHDVQLMNGNGKPSKTFFAFFPFSRIDHVFVSPHFEVEHVRVPQTALTRTASDHLPLVADLKLRDASGVKQVS